MSDLFSSFEAITKLAESNQGQGQDGVPLMYLYWGSKAGEDKDKIIRLLHEGCITVPYHEMVRTQAGKYADAVCLESEIIQNRKTCPLCATGNVAKERGMGVAVQREEKLEGDGPNRRSVVRDKMIDLENSGRQALLGTIKQSVNNFWSNLSPVSVRYGAVTNRDLQVTRVGSGTSTSYTFLPFDVDPELDSIDKVLARYEKIMGGKSPQDLILQRVNSKSSDAYYKKNFGIGIFAEQSRDQPQQYLSVVEESAPSNGSKSDQEQSLSNLRTKLQSYNDNPPF